MRTKPGQVPQNNLPKVTVLMPAYNVARYIQASVESILAQTFTDFEFIVIDDGSSDETCALLNSFQDTRMRVYHNEQNIGYVRTLNRGLELARAEFIARQDADDISMPHRLETQLNFLEQHPAIGLLGSACRYISEDGRQKKTIYRVPCADLDIRWVSMLANPFLHPTVMFRHSTLREHGLNYDPNIWGTEDYDLWVKMLQFTEGANLPEPLLFYRMHANQVTVKSRSVQLHNHNQVIVRTLREQVGLDVTLEQARFLRCIYGPGGEEIENLERHRAETTLLYLELLKGFMNNYRGRPGIGKIQRQALAWVRRILLSKPWRSENFQLLPKLIVYW